MLHPLKDRRDPLPHADAHGCQADVLVAVDHVVDEPQECGYTNAGGAAAFLPFLRSRANC